MRKFLLIVIWSLFACVLAASLIGCKAKSHVVESVEADTAKADTSSLSVKSLVIDTTSRNESKQLNITIEFVTDGGTLSVGKGALAVDGIRLIRVNDSTKREEAKVTTSATDMSGTKASRQSATVSRKSEQDTPITETVTTKVTRWYDKAFAFVGCLCCIAALLFAIFLYLKNKH